MNESLANKLLSMISNTDDKKISEALDRTMNILKKHNVDEIKNAIMNNDFSRIMDEPQDVDIRKLIDILPESKKIELCQKFNSSDVQEALKTDESKALDILKQTLFE